LYFLLIIGHYEHSIDCLKQIPTFYDWSETIKYTILFSKSTKEGKKVGMCYIFYSTIIHGNQNNIIMIIETVCVTCGPLKTHKNVHCIIYHCGAIYGTDSLRKSRNSIWWGSRPLKDAHYNATRWHCSPAKADQYQCKRFVGLTYRRVFFFFL